MTRVRVLIVAPSLGILGGQAVVAKALCDRLAATAGVEVGFLAVNPALPGLLGWLQRFKYVRTIVTSLAYGYTLLSTVWRYDVIHAFSASYYSYLLAPLPALLAARAFGRKALLNYHSGEAEDHLTHWPLSRWTIRSIPHRVIVQSAYLAHTFAKFGIKSSAIANFVALEPLPFRARPRPSPRIISNRNLEPMYNVGAIVRAFAIVQQAHPEAELLIAGDGSQRSMLEELVATLRLQHVTFVGRIPNQDLGALLNRSDIYANASLIDNMPMSIIEAFACGLPVVTSDAGGIPFMVAHEETGLIIAGGSSEGLALAIIRLLGEPGLADRLTRNARAECEHRYTWSRVEAKWRDCYDSLANERLS